MVSPIELRLGIRAGCSRIPKQTIVGGSKMALDLSPRGLAARSARRPWITIGVWALTLVIAMALIATLIGDSLTTDLGLTGEPESKRADAVIMVAVFVGFASGDLVMFQQMEFGLAVAVLIDATVVRSVPVPASMRMLGDANWYLRPPAAGRGAVVPA